MSGAVILSGELHTYATMFDSLASNNTPLTRPQLARMAEEMQVFSRLAYAMECELGAFRLGELARLGREAVEKLAADEFGEMIFNPEGKIIRPDFGRK